jgi:ADP-ribose pyrophosphatase YjhB (NUDIX family)
LYFRITLLTNKLATTPNTTIMIRENNTPPIDMYTVPGDKVILLL